MTTRNPQNLRLVLWGLVVVALIAVGTAWLVGQRGGAGGSFSAGTSVLGKGDYTLETTSGAPFTEATLKGGHTAVFFGYTRCPDICPTTLGDIATWEEELGDEAKDLKFYFVTVDPERDSAEVLEDYVSWAPRVTGVTGSPAEVQKAIKAFRIYAQKTPYKDGGYGMDHSSNILLFGPDGDLDGLIGYQEGDERALAALRRLLAA